eukprot:scaffold35936_cov33-Phaeocystis_antarctica.AAC.2
MPVPVARSAAELISSASISSARVMRPPLASTCRRSSAFRSPATTVRAPAAVAARISASHAGSTTSAADCLLGM